MKKTVRIIVGILFVLATCGYPSKAELRPGLTASSSIEGINEISHLLAPFIF